MIPAWTALRRFLPLLLLAAGAALWAVPSGAATLEVGKGKPYKMPSAAIAAAHDGDTVLIAAGTYFDCAVVSQNNITIAGTGPHASAVLTDKECAGKASLVIDGHNVTIKNLTLQRIRVPDGNGAGIRAEGTNLTVDHVKFINNQDGLLGAPVPDSTVLIENSLFDSNGTCAHACAHGLYMGKVKLLRVVDTSFVHTREGHDIKSRAARTEVIGCHFRDGKTGTASYEVEAPNGGALVVRNNVMEKGPKAGNHAVIVIGDEGVTQPTPEILVENNRLRVDGDYTALFVHNLTATPAVLKGNTFSGSVTPLEGDGSVH